MSSHHIVRDEQEPALLVYDAEAVGFDTVGHLLEWSPTVVVVGEAIGKVASWGIKLDIAVCAHHGLSECQDMLANQDHVKFLTYNLQKEALSTAMYFLRAGRYPSVNIMCQFDHSIAQFLEGFHPTMDTVVLDNGYRWFYIKNGVFRKWVPKGQVFKILADQPTDAYVTTGLTHCTLVNAHAWVAPEEGQMAIHHPKPFWLGEAI